MKNRISIIAHRGDSFFYPENSQESVYSAYTNKTCQAIEIDIRMTKDQVLVLNHEMKIYDVEQTFPLIKNVDWETLKTYLQESYRFDWHHHYYHVLLSTDRIHTYYIYCKLQRLWNQKAHFITLPTCLVDLPKRKTLFIEIKGKNTDYDTNKTYQKVIGDTIEKHIDKNLYVKSFHLETLYYIKERFGNDIKVGALISKSKISHLEKEFDFYSIDFSLVIKQPTLISQYLITPTKKKEFYVWTIDDYDAYCLYLKIFEPYQYFPGIITNNPEIIYACQYIYQQCHQYEEFINRTKNFKMTDMITYTLHSSF